MECSRTGGGEIASGECARPLNRLRARRWIGLRGDGGGADLGGGCHRRRAQKHENGESPTAPSPCIPMAVDLCRTAR